MRRLALLGQVVLYGLFLSLVIGLWPQSAFAQLSCSSTQITPTDNVSYGPSITADGTRIAFTSDGNLTGQNPNSYQELFVFNTTTNVYTQITNTIGFSAGNISADGKFIGFFTEQDPNLFLYDVTNNTTVRITNIVPALDNGHVGSPTLSADGSRIAFDSNADVTGENPNGNTEIFLFNRTTNTITQITHTTTGTGVNLTPWISADGTRITFYSFADHTGGNPDHNYEIFLFDIGTNTLTQITHTSGSGVVNQRPTANATGRLIAFDSNANLTGGNPDGSLEIFLFHTLTSTFQQITSNMGSVTEFAAINASGTRIVFSATGLSLFDLTTNSFTQLSNLQTGGFATIDANGNRIAVNFGNKVFLIDCGTTAPNTPPGNNVVVAPVNTTTGTSPVTLTFAAVTQEGTTTLTTSSSGPTPPAGFSLGAPPTYYDLTTTAVFSGSVEVCIDYSGVSLTNESDLKLFHFEGGAWVDATTLLDTINDTICASVTSLSPFAVGESVYHATAQQPLNLDGSSVFNAKRGVVPAKFRLTVGGVPTCNLPPATIALTRTAGGTIGSINESVYSTPADSGATFRISDCQYLYNIGSSALGPGTYQVGIKINGSVVGSATFGLR